MKMNKAEQLLMEIYHSELSTNGYDRSLYPCEEIRDYFKSTKGIDIKKYEDEWSDEEDEQMKNRFFHSINNNTLSEEDLQISCPKCEYQMEGYEKDNGELDKDYIPEHYCFPLSNNFRTEYFKVNNKWIREDK